MAVDKLNLRTIAVVPAYNEQDTVARVVNEIRQCIPAIDVVVVDDGSSDGTYRVAKATHAYVLRHPFNMGIGSTVQTGFKFAFRRGYDAAVQIDGDGQHDPKYISRMLDIVSSGEADIVSGSRFLECEGFQSSFMRRMGIKFFEFIYRMLVGIRVTDCTSGLRLFGGDALGFVANDYPEDYPEPESIIMLHKAGFRFFEIPVVMRERQGGKTSIRGIKPFHYMMKVTLALLMNKLRKIEK